MAALFSSATRTTLLAALRDSVGAGAGEHIQESTDPLRNFIDWLDEPDKVIDAEGRLVYVWCPVRLPHDERIYELAVVDFGSFRGVCCRPADSHRGSRA